MNKKILLILSTCIALNACGGGNSNEQPQIEEENEAPAALKSLQGSAARQATGAPLEDLTSATNGGTSFALDLYKNISGRDEAQNLVVSPHSIFSAFAMLQAGANGDTALQLNTAFNFDLASDNLHQAFNTINQTLDAANINDGIEITIVNSQWGEQSYDFSQSYLDVLSRYYGADIKIVDFINQSEAARLLINDWVETNTNNLIQDLLPAGSVSSNTKMLLVNAIYFNAKWQNAFSQSATADRNFTFLNNSQGQVPTMRTFDTFNYYDDGNQSLVELPYQGEDFSMYILHSHVSQFLDIETALSADSLEQMIQQMQSEYIQLSVPKFSFTSDIALVQILKEMGVVDAFDPNQADFSLMNSRGNKGLFVGQAIHKANITTNEEGTEAAAATGIEISVTSVPNQPDTLIDIDSPFIFVIRHNQTGTILFMGRVLDPSAQ